MVDKEFRELEKQGYFVTIDKRSKEYKQYKKWKAEPKKESEDTIIWRGVKDRTTSRLLNADWKTLCSLHSKYFNHKYQEICCDKPKLIKWIADLDEELL